MVRYRTPFLLREECDVAAGLLWALRGDAGQRVIAAWHFGWEPARAVSGHAWMAPTWAALLNDSYAAVRWVTFDALRRDPRFDELNYDFDGSPAERQKVADAVMRLWSQRQEPLAYPVPDRPQVLLSEQGTLRRDQFNSILRRRDNRMMVGVE